LKNVFKCGGLSASSVTEEFSATAFDGEKEAQENHDVGTQRKVHKENGYTEDQRK